MVKKYKLLNNFGVADNHAPFLNGLGDNLTLVFDEELKLDLLCGDNKITTQTVDKRVTVPQDFLTETLRLRANKGGKKYLLESVGVQYVDLKTLPEYIALENENNLLRDQLAVAERQLTEKTEVII